MREVCEKCSIRLTDAGDALICSFECTFCTACGDQMDCTCPNCGGGELKIIAAIPERPVIERILTHLGLNPQPPPWGRARKPGIDFAA